MATHEVRTHEVEYLSVANATITDGAPPIQRPIAIITVRPDENSFRPHSISIPRQQAARLLEDLKAVLSRSAVCLVLLLAVTGCSGEIEIEEKTATLAGDPPAQTAGTKDRTRVAVDLLTDREMVMENGQALEAPDGVLTVNGCLHFHQTLIIHLNESDRASERTAIEIVREWTDEGCERHRRK
jgi:hypothetical protein